MLPGLRHKRGLRRAGSRHDATESSWPAGIRCAWKRSLGTWRDSWFESTDGDQTRMFCGAMVGTGFTALVAGVTQCLTGWLVGQGSGEAEAGQGAGVVEAGEGGDLVALEGEDEQPGGVRDRGVLVAQV